ncbi:MAG: hypothetical protein IIU19_05730 [Oscillospiraceae bacterium]|nr:hypothetical protein [Oscillospiraceae bacterium]
MAERKMDPLEETKVLEDTTSAFEDTTEELNIPTDSAAAPAAAPSAGINTPKTKKKSRKKKKAAQKRQKLEQEKKAQQKPEEPEEAPVPEPVTAAEPKPGTAPAPVSEPQPEPEVIPEPVPEPEPEPEPVPEPKTKKAFRSEKKAVKEQDKTGHRRIWKKVVAALFALMLTAGLTYGGYRIYAHIQTERYIEYRKGLPYLIESMESTGEFDDDGLVTVTVKITEDEYKDGVPLYCITDRNYLPLDNTTQWQQAKDWKCTFSVGPGHYYFHLKDCNNVYTTSSEELSKLDSTLAVKLVGYRADLAVGAFKKGYTYELATLGNADPEVTWTVGDSEILEAAQGAVRGLKPGNSTLIVSADGHSDSVDVLVTDMITLPNSNTYKKPLLQGDVYTPEEEAVLDSILFARVEEAGDMTRGGVVAATRFLTLEFPYRVPYFFENGRMDPYLGGSHYCDGEGRYYHKGLYLTSAKYDEIDPKGIRWGPAHWGAPLYNWEEKYHFKPGQKYPNGLDCSSFVCWCLRNGGFDFGDVGAGAVAGQFELSDLGEQRPISTELLQSDEIRPGDLIYTDGHMALIVGISEEKLYVAEALFNCVRVTSFARRYSAVPHALYTHINLMSEEYAKAGNGEGKWTMMWDWYEGMEDVDRNWNQEWR